MKKIAIYGLGERFRAFFCMEDSGDLIKRLKKGNYEIVGCMDANASMREICLDNEMIPVVRKEEWKDFGIDYVVVTSDKYFEEIKCELLDCGFKEEQIWDLLSFFGSVIYDIEFLGEQCGIEIGGPSDIFKRIYQLCKSCDGVNFSEDTVWWKKDGNRYGYKGRMLGQVYIADATDLSVIADNQYDFVLSSNNVEHIANPLKALKEFCRILKRDGVIVIAVPVKERTFDHNRKDTSFEHLCQDYDNDIREDDLSHLLEILELHDYSMDLPCGGKEAFARRAEQNVHNRCLHHHVFSEMCLRQMYKWLNLEIIDFWKVAENYIILGRKQ